MADQGAVAGNQNEYGNAERDREAATVMDGVEEDGVATATTAHAHADTTTMEPAAAAAPPPPSQQPQPQPGPRAARFMDLYQQTLSKMLSTVTYEDFAACFPTVAGAAEGSLREMHNLFVGRLREFAEAEVNDIFRERHVVENLNALEDLLADARKRRARAIDGEDPPPPSHTLSPSTILSAHLAPQLAQQQSQLNAKLQTTQSQNATLFQEILAQRKELASLVDGLESTVADLDGAVRSLDVDVESGANGGVGLGQVVREVDAEMAVL